MKDRIYRAKKHGTAEEAVPVVVCWRLEGDRGKLCVFVVHWGLVVGSFVVSFGEGAIPFLVIYPVCKLC